MFRHNQLPLANCSVTAHTIYMVTPRDRGLSRRTFAFALPPALGALRHVALGEGGNQKMPGEPFQIHFDEVLRKDLQRRLADTRWSDAVTSDWRYGMKKSFLKTLIEYWQTTYSFDAAEHRMNTMAPVPRDRWRVRHPLRAFAGTRTTA